MAFRSSLLWEPTDHLLRRDAPEVGRYADPVWVRLKTQLVDWLSFMLDRKTRLGAVRKLQFLQQDRKMAPGHSHPRAAALRSDASVFMSKVGETLGKRRYDVSVSARERGGLATGPRQLRVSKDLLSDQCQARLLRSDLVSMVDTDYYMSEDQLCGYAGHDMVMYTLQPDGVSGVTSDSRWSFVSSGMVTEEVAGGATYTHEVWDWSGDMVVLSRGYSTFVYDLVSFQVGPARKVVALILAREVRLPKWIFGWLYPDAAKYGLRRMRVGEHGRYLVGGFGGPARRMVSIKPANAFGVSPVHVSEDTFYSLGIAARIPNADKKVVSMELLPSAVERICKAAGEGAVKLAGCYLLSDYFTSSYQPHQLVNYQSCGVLTLEEGVSNAALAAVPVAGRGCAPTSSHNNEARAIQARVLDVRNVAEFTDELRGYAREFCDLVVTRAHKGVPWSIEELREAQPKPTQRARRLREEVFTADERAHLTTSSFQKKETYAKVGDPRLINQVPTDHTNRLCAYAGAFKVALAGRSNAHWFMVGKTPLGIAHSLRNLQRKAGDQLVGGDYSRMDGRTSVSYRKEVLQPCMERFFHPKYHRELVALLGKEENAKTVTRSFGERADMGGANLSGSGVTTILNTLDAAYNEFAARRRSGNDPVTAFKRLGCYFGDDSAVGPSVFEATKAVAKECGMVLEAEEVPADAGAGYVVFLSRVYPDVETSLSSHPCIVRALRKACTVQVPPGAPGKVLATKLRLKVEGILTTDSHVPVLSEYAQALRRVYQLEALSATGGEWEDAKSKDASYKAKLVNGAYPCETGDRALLVTSLGMSLGLSPEEIELLARRLDNAKDEQDLLACSLSENELALPQWASWVPTDPVAI